MDIYDWILSEEIREYLRANHRFSFDEKVLIIHTAYRSLEEKYAAFQALSEETENQEDREVLSQMCKLYDWIFEQMYGEMPGQVFLYALPSGCNVGVTIPRYQVVGVFHTYEELMDFIENEASYRIDAVTVPCKIDDPDSKYELEEAEGIGEAFRIEKWAYVDGKMKGIVLFDAFKIRGHCCFRDFLIKADGYDRFEEFVRQTGISERAVKLFNSDIETNPIPLPFQDGDLVCLDLPWWMGKWHGVMKTEVIIARSRNFVKKYTYVNMHYMACYKNSVENPFLESINLTSWNIDYTLNLPVVQWLRHASPSELSEGEALLAELSSGLCRLRECDKEAADGIALGGEMAIDKSLQDVIAEIHSILEEDASS